jgi:transketolase
LETPEKKATGAAVTPSAVKAAPLVTRTPLVEPRLIRRTILDMLFRANAAHVGPNMSPVEILSAMYAFVDVEKIKAGTNDRSRIIISKGHCAAATYATMAHYGLVPFESLTSYIQDGSKMIGLVGHVVPHVEHSTGSLGHGLGVGAGAAVSLRNHGHHDSSVLVLLGDSELHEGSNWEALMLIKHHKLKNLVAVVDDNKIGNIDHTVNVLDMRRLANRFIGFGYRTIEVDGHDVVAVYQAIAEIRGGEQPGVVVCNTVKGKGVPCAEDLPIWHFKTLTPQQYKEALQHLGFEE